MEASFGQFPDHLRDTFARSIDLGSGEELDDVLAGAALLADRRAAVHSRAEPEPIDFEYALALFCWWRLKPELESDARERMYELRRDLFLDAAQAPEMAFERLRVVPDEALALSLDDLYALQQSGEWPPPW